MKNEILTYRDYLVDEDASEHTIKSYMRALYTLHDFLNPLNIGITDIRKNHLQEFIDSIREDYSTATKNNFIYVIKSFFIFLLKYDYIEGDPSSALECDKIKFNVTQPITNDEFAKLINFKTETISDFRDKALFLFLYETGANPQEILDTPIKNIDFENKTVFFTRNNIKRSIPLSTELINLLIKYIDLKKDVSIDDYLFVSERSNKLDRRSIHYIIKQRVEAANIRKDISSMAFRSAFVDTMLKNGADIRDIKTMLGHSHIYLTERIVMALPREGREN